MSETDAGRAVPYRWGDPIRPPDYQPDEWIRRAVDIGAFPVRFIIGGKPAPIICTCDPMATHSFYCEGSPLFAEVTHELRFNPLAPVFGDGMKFFETWHCVVHGLLGDINGPVHYETCPRHADPCPDDWDTDED